MSEKPTRSIYGLGFEELRNANVNRCETVFHPVNEWSPTDWATALGGETGEALNFVKKLRRLDGADKSIDTPAARAELTFQIANELADIICYADLLAARLDINLGLAVVEKFNEVSDRRGSSIKL